MRKLILRLAPLLVIPLILAGVLFRLWSLWSVSAEPHLRVAWWHSPNFGTAVCLASLVLLAVAWIWAVLCERRRR